MITELAALQDATAAIPDDDRGVIWVAETASLAAVDPASGDVRRHSAFPRTPSGIALSADRQRLLIACEDGTVTAIGADDPDGAFDDLASAPGESLGQAAATRPVSGPGSALAVSEAGRVLAVSLTDKQIRNVVTLPGVSGVATLGSRVFAAANIAGGGRVVHISGGAAQAIISGLLTTGHVTATPDGKRLLVAHPAADRASALTLADGSVVTGVTETVPGTLVELHGLADGRLILLTTDALALVDDFSDLHSRPRLVPPKDPLFVGSWVKLQYDLSGSGLTDADVSFVVTDGPDVAIVSHTETVTPIGGGVREPLLVAGGLLGTFGLDMVETATGNVLDSTSFEVTDEWHDPDFGPSAFIQGEGGGTSGGDWGGGPNAPQNLSTVPHNGSWRVGVLMVNTADGAYPTEATALAAARKAILDEVQDGVAVSGTTRSARHYYEELSGWNAATNRGLTVRAHNNQVFGPVTLPNGWGTYFQQKKNAAGAVIDARWSSMGTTVQTIVTRAFTDGIMTTADFSAIDVLLLVPFSPDTTAGTAAAPARFVWPHAWPSQPYLAGASVSTDQRSFAAVFVPPDFAVHDGRRVHATLSHEIGHTLGLPDLYNFPEYTPDITNRLTMNWDMMAGSRNDMPHFSLSNRMRQGWVQAGHLRLFNFSVAPAGGVVNETVTLHAAELPPPAGRVRGIEIRLSDGWNTYIEYRAKQASQFSDTLPADRRVVITDVTSDSFAAPVARPPIVFVHNDADGDGPILDTNLDYDEIDPSSQKQLTVRVVSTAADNAVVNIKYDSGQRPDPGIRPWTGGPDWRSPDIEVRNAKSIADPAKWANTPWLGNMNTVVAKVRNNGDLLAKGVVVDFFVIEYTTGDGPMVPLGTDVKDIAAGATVEFTTSWVPPVDRHYCVVVRIRLYQDPATAGLFETNIFNNEARTNYTRFVSASSSPSTRVTAQIQLANPFDESALVHAVVNSSHPYHRVFLDHRWLRVDGKSNRPVQVYDEALAGFSEADFVDDERVLGLLWKEDNQVTVEGWAERPFLSDCGAPTLTGGAAVRVGSGRATEIEITDAKQTFMGGLVRHVDDGSPVDDGTVVIVAREVDEFGGHQTADGQLDGGRFAIEFGGHLKGAEQVGEAHFLGSFGAAPCDSRTVKLES